MAPDPLESVPPDVLAVTGRYHRVERLVSVAVAVAVGIVAAVFFVTLTFAPGLLVAAGVLLAARAPIFRTAGTARWRTDADPDAVRAAFEGPTPPPLVLQWGVADRIGAGSSTAVYEFAYLLGLRTTHMTVEAVEPSGEEASDADLELRVTAGDAPWGAYRVSITDDDEATVVDLVVLSQRRFGLRSLPQVLLASRYRPAALDALGYTVVENDVELSV